MKNSIRTEPATIPPYVNAPRDAYACTIHQNGDELLVTLFNFTGKPLDFDVEKIGKIRVAPNDVELRQVKR